MDLIDSIYTAIRKFKIINVSSILKKNVDVKRDLKSNLESLKTAIINSLLDEGSDTDGNASSIKFENKSESAPGDKMKNELDELLLIIYKCLKQSDSLIEAYDVLKEGNTCVVCESKVDKYCTQCKKRFCDPCVQDYHNLFSKKDHLQKHVTSDLPPDSEKFSFIEDLFKDLFELIRLTDSNEIKSLVVTHVETERILVANQETKVKCNICGNMRDSNLPDCPSCLIPNEHEIICSNCSIRNIHNAKYCSRCGKQLIKELSNNHIAELVKLFDKKKDEMKKTEAVTPKEIKSKKTSFLYDLDLDVEDVAIQTVQCKKCGFISNLKDRICFSCGDHLKVDVKDEPEKLIAQNIDTEFLFETFKQGRECPKCTYVSDNTSKCPMCGFSFNNESEKQNIETDRLFERRQESTQRRECPKCSYVSDNDSKCPMCEYSYETSNTIQIIENTSSRSNSIEESEGSINSDTVTCPKCTFEYEKADRNCPVCTHVFKTTSTSGVVIDTNNNREKTILKLIEKKPVMNRILNRLKENRVENMNLLNEIRNNETDCENTKSQFVNESFKKLMAKITSSEESNAAKSSRLLMANIYILLKSLERDEEMCKITREKTEIFANAVRENTDTEMDFEDCIEAITNSNSLESSKRYLSAECGICFSKRTMNKILNLNCQCSICIDCFKHGYKLAINSIESLISINEFSCLVCKMPKFDPKNKDEFQLHLDFLVMLINHHLDQEDSDKLQKNLTEIFINDMKNFIWCQHGCNSGYLVENVAYYEAVLKVYCKNCRKYTCFKCKEKWEAEHEGRTCEEYKKFRADNGVSEYLSNNSIVCPYCNTTFKLDVGACLHYTCIKCKYQFCGSCKCQMSAERMNDCTTLCEKSGLHGHHPYNCFTYIRDFTVNEMAEYLEMNGKELCLDLEGTHTTCDYRITDSDGNDTRCSEAVVKIKDTETEYCEKHLKQHLYYRITDEKLDPLSLYDNKSLKLIIQKCKSIEPDVKDKTEAQIRETYMEFINRNIQKKDLTGFRF